MKSPRVVSLLPSATETLCAIGGGGMLVGRSHECNFPAGLEGVPVLTGQRINEGTPAQIDAQVRETLGAAGAQSLYTIDGPALAALAPDVILTQDLCDVCSIDLATVKRLAAQMPREPMVVSLNPGTVEEILDDVLRVGGATGLERAAGEVVVRLRERLFAAGEYVNPYDDGASVALLEWTDPLFVGGHWSVQLIERAGGGHPLNPTRLSPGSGAAAGPQSSERRAGKSVRVTHEQLVASAPEWVVIAPCGFGLERAWAAAADLAKEPWWGQLPAVKRGRVAVVDGDQMFNRPGPRVVDAFEWLVGWINDRPGLMPRGFPWRPMGGAP
ncbi:MAG: ABC transporter substrate-binding protein [Phycisphaeraceae bacterium]|nr:ABC transporter substrate-binding protein [Phycisphaeraceae bacterium]